MGYKPSGAAKSRREEDGEAPSEETSKGPHRLAETGDRAVGAAVLVTAMALAIGVGSCARRRQLRD